MNWKGKEFPSYDFCRSVMIRYFGWVDDDVIQDVYVSAMIAVDRLNQAGLFNWFKMSLRNQSIDALRKRKRRLLGPFAKLDVLPVESFQERQTIDFDHAASIVADRNQDLEYEFNAREERAMLDAVLDYLPPKQRRLLSARMKGQSFRAMAVAEGSTECKTRMKFHRVLRKVRRNFKPEAE